MTTLTTLSNRRLFNEGSCINKQTIRKLILVGTVKMEFVSEHWMMNTAALVVAMLTILYIYFKIKFAYWRKRGVPYLEPTIPFGNIGDVICLRKQMGENMADIYKNLKGQKYGGFFQLHKPTFVFRDPELIKNYLVKHFSHFHDRGIYIDEENDPLAVSLVFISGQKWRNLRAKLTPTFTSGKLKVMFQTILDCGLELKDCVKLEALRGDTIEVKDLVARYSTDVIASCAFGIECNCLKDPSAEFRLKGKAFFERSVLQSIGFLLNFLAPSLAAIVKWGNTPTHLSDFFRKMVRDTIEYREKNAVTRPDFMQLMIQLKNKGYVDVDKDSGEVEKGPETNVPIDTTRKLTVDEIAAQAFIFFLGGFETSSTTVSFCMHELAVNPDIQNRLRQEMDQVLAQHGGQITYDAVLEMEYLDRVIAETLRKYPPVPILNRECTTEYRVPDSDVVIEQGTQVVVPVLALHHDPRYYPEPQRFDPERFTAEEKAKRSHYVYLPFGEGPRICIGMRFGLMQTKVALIALLSNYEFRVSEKTSVPLTFDPKSFTLSPKGGIFLQIVNREEVKNQ